VAENLGTIGPVNECGVIKGDDRVPAGFFQKEAVSGH
jgi:hypothetical protein